MKEGKKGNKIRKEGRAVHKAEGIKKEIKEFFAQDWVPVEDISYGMVKMKLWAGGGYVKIVEVSPIPFLLLPPEERVDLLVYFYEWLKIAPAHLQFHMITTKTSVNELVSSILRKTSGESDAIVLKRRDAYIKKIRDLSAAESLSKRFFIVYGYEGGENGSSDNIESIAETMYETQAYIRYYLGKVGNSLVEHEDDNMFQAELLYNELNPKSCVKEPFENRVARVASDYQSYMLSKDYDFNLSDIPLEDYLAARGIVNKNSGYIIRDGLFESSLYIRGDGYRHSVVSGWMEEFTNFGEGMTVNLYAGRKNRHKMIEEAGRTVRIKRSCCPSN